MKASTWTYKSVLPVRLALGALLIFLFVAPAFSFKLATKSSEEERRLSQISTSYRVEYLEAPLARWSLSIFTEPVHEEITNRMYGCDGDAEVCAGDVSLTAPAPVLAGVRWNDDPPFRLSANQAKNTSCKTKETVRFETQPSCWVTLFRDANKGAVDGEEYGRGHAMLYRTHFGDLQFLHSMAARDGEVAYATKAKLMGWFEFTWRAAAGEYTLDTRLKEIENPTVRAAFGNTDWRLQDLYTTGAGNGLRRRIDDVAFGSLLHALQDSFAAGHAEREESTGTQRCSAGNITVKAPGTILSFHAYNHQEHSQHAEADSRASFMRHLQEQGDVVELGRALVEAREAKMDWPTVQPMFDCMFTLLKPAAPAGPGEFVATP